MKLVLDASAAITAVRTGPHFAAILDAVHAATLVVAPDLYISEVGNAFWKYVVAGEIDAESAAEDLDACRSLIDRFVPVSDIAQEALREAVTYKHPVYDLVYAIAARREGCVVLTVDARLRKVLAAMKVPAVRL